MTEKVFKLAGVTFDDAQKNIKKFGLLIYILCIFVYLLFAAREVRA